MMSAPQTQERIREILRTNGHMADANQLESSLDLYAAGLTSFSAVRLMLALEGAFDIEFPNKMLNRRSFSSIDAITHCVEEIAELRARN